jgi:hypothetical protein
MTLQQMPATPGYDGGQPCYHGVAAGAVAPRPCLVLGESHEDSSHQSQRLYHTTTEMQEGKRETVTGWGHRQSPT